jgi:hypothetical protein
LNPIIQAPASVTVGALVALTGGPSDGLAQASALRLAVEAVNSNSSILPNTTFVLDMRDTASAQRDSVVQAINLEGDGVVGYIGASTSATAQTVQWVAQTFGLPQVRIRFYLLVHLFIPLSAKLYLSLAYSNSISPN